MSHTSITDDALRHVKAWPKLQHLNIGLTEVTDKGLGQLKTSSPLSLWLTDTQVTDRGMQILAETAQLQRLGIARTQVSNTGLSYLAKLNTLEELSLDDTGVTDAGLQHLSRLTNLRNINLKGTVITDAGLEHLAKLKNLQVVNLTYTKVTPAGVAKLDAALKHSCKIIVAPKIRAESGCPGET